MTESSEIERAIKGLTEATLALTKACQHLAALVGQNQSIEKFVPTREAVEILGLRSRRPLFTRAANGGFKHGIHYRRIGTRDLEFNCKKVQEYFNVDPARRKGG